MPARCPLDARSMLAAASAGLLLAFTPDSLPSYRVVPWSLR
jgi:hypothetical protein